MPPIPNPARARLADSSRHAPEADAELYVVEGESAAGAVASLRDARLQAVLPLQGKPMNAHRASAAKVAAYPWFGLLAAALGAPGPTGPWEAALPGLRFQRLMLLFDPDADGIHIGALTILYLHRWMPALLESGRVWMVRAPAFEVESTDPQTGEIATVLADTPMQARALLETAQRAGRAAAMRGFRGLAGLPVAVLRERCLEPATRRAAPLTARDVQGVVEVFGGAR